ncbi:hypothetical protein BDP27DRAFT_1373205 [Rhodocollybia butyracea]|uniref:Uncharacterized protein n=1 Tax=Rhodocollybia butyracea TaxID=206335 RepID=A0A9P5P7G4_9AGAR|nr:hypothetical protein BDP27DRAFT_1373205 [Rhodocollybia butyracea]
MTWILESGLRGAGRNTGGTGVESLNASSLTAKDLAQQCGHQATVNQRFHELQGWGLLWGPGGGPAVIATVRAASVAVTKFWSEIKARFKGSRQAAKFTTNPATIRSSNIFDSDIPKSEVVTAGTLMFGDDLQAGRSRYQPLISGSKPSLSHDFGNQRHQQYSNLQHSASTLASSKLTQLFNAIGTGLRRLKEASKKQQESEE